MKTKDRQSDNFVVTGRTVSCHNDNRWRQNCQIDYLLFSVDIDVIMARQDNRNFGWFELNMHSERLSMKRKCDFVILRNFDHRCTHSYRFDKFWYNQWQTFHQHDDLSNTEIGPGQCISGSAFIKPDQPDPWIKDQIKIVLLSTISPLQLPNFVSCGRDKPSHMTQNFVTLGAKLWTAERFVVDPWSMNQADLVW